MKIGKFLVSVSLLFLLATGAHAYKMDDIILESTSGTGDNSALLVIDFWPDNGLDDSFAFEALFKQGSINGNELMDIVQAGDSNFTYSGGSFVTWIQYVDPDTSTTYRVDYDWPDAWWSEWISDDFGETWGFGGGVAADTFGPDASSNTLGWLAKDGDDWTSEPVTSAVPVPAAVWLLGSGLLGLIGIRRRNQ